MNHKTIDLILINYYCRVFLFKALAVHSKVVSNIISNITGTEIYCLIVFFNVVILTVKNQLYKRPSLSSCLKRVIYVLK